MKFVDKNWQMFLKSFLKSLFVFREAFDNYDPNNWDYNGPLAVLRAVQKICKKTKMIDLMRPKLCWGFKIIPDDVFFPHRPFKVFITDPQIVQNVLSQIASDTVALHQWSNQTNVINIVESRDRNVYTILAEQFSPDAFESSGPNFD